MIIQFLCSLIVFYIATKIQTLKLAALYGSFSRRQSWLKSCLLPSLTSILVVWIFSSKMKFDSTKMVPGAESQNSSLARIVWDRSVACQWLSVAPCRSGTPWKRNRQGTIQSRIVLMSANFCAHGLIVVPPCTAFFYKHVNITFQSLLRKEKKIFRIETQIEILSR